MKDQVRDMFDQITMPENTIQRVRQVMAAKAGGRTPRRSYSTRRPAAVAAAFLTVILLASATLNTEVRAAVNEFVKRYVFHGGLTVIERREDGVSSVSYGSSMHLFVETREDGRLYFIGNGENIDITDMTSMEKPYIHTYTDADGIEHLLIVGGTPENFGMTEFYRESGGDQEGWQDWIGGNSENYMDMETGKAYSWLARAWEELNIPWPLPGD